MKKKMIRVFIAMGCMLGGTVCAMQIKDMSIDQLQAKEKELMSILSEYWVDKNGEMFVSSKNDTLQFTFTESMMNRMTEAQLRSAMNAAISRFNAVQKQAFMKEVDVPLQELGQVKTAIAAQKEKMDQAAAELAKILGKTADDVMRLADANITALIGARVTNDSIKMSANAFATTLKKLRPAFGVTTKDEVKEKAEAKTEAKAATKAAVAGAIATTDFKLASIAGFIGTAVQYGMCRDRIFDIVKDSETIYFTTEAR